MRAAVVFPVPGLPFNRTCPGRCLCLPFPAWDRNLFWCSSKAPSRIICLNSASHHVSEAAEIFSDEKTSKISKCLITFLLKIVWDQDSKIVWHLLWPLSTRSVMGEKFFGDFSLFGCMFVVCNVLFAAFWSWNLSVCCFNTVLALEPAIWKAIATCFSWNSLRCICVAFRKQNLFVGRIFFNCCAHDTRPKMFPW